MASIQQSLNQMLVTAGVGAGLYAQSPAGKEAAEVRNIKRNMPKLEKQIEEASAGVTKEPSASDEMFTKAFEKGVKQSERLFELRPSAETAAQHKELSEVFKEWEEALSSSMAERQGTLQKQQESLEMRKELLKNAPNSSLGVREKNIKWKEDNTNGN